ncbi:uncharacterized protein LOC110860133 [Folsomia candida]|uniref:Juvenile hormone acid O-methyltransferase n=1 Tax=Folsomia candida TaxID=158441 RepID=A0A226F621_FOLCA|nr:uncharacterized protein LOC110860133 [Folsomia candida]OXA65229.1 Juvenile hormone acid O-methyltransferase [Folsomia candida]
MENPLRYETFKSENPTISSTYSKNAEELVESMSWEEGDIIMDYGCGSGQFMTEYLFPKIPNPRCICGVDISPNMIRFAYENCKNKENIYFAIGDIMDKYQWTFKEKMVSKFVAYLVLCYVQDYRGFISKVYDFLKPGGQVGMLVPFSKAYGIPHQLLSQEKWAQYAEKKELTNHSSFAPWTYAEDIDAPSSIKDSLLSCGFRIDRFTVNDIKLEFPSIRNLCEFLCTITSALSTVPEKFHDDFMEEMIDYVTSNLGSSRGVTTHPGDNNSSVISVEWKFLNFVATKP